MGERKDGRREEGREGKKEVERKGEVTREEGKKGRGERRGIEGKEGREKREGERKEKRRERKGRKEKKGGEEDYRRRKKGNPIPVKEVTTLWIFETLERFSQTLRKIKQTVLATESPSHRHQWNYVVEGVLQLEDPCSSLVTACLAPRLHCLGSPRGKKRCRLVLFVTDSHDNWPSLIFREPPRWDEMLLDQGKRRNQETMVT